MISQLYTTTVYQNVRQINRRLLAWSDNDVYVDWLYVFVCLFLTCMAGLMSGLTLGLLSLDTVDLELLLRSGTAREQKYARKIMPLISNSHLLLVTLLMCNAVAMEALPLFLDKLADPVTAVIVSVTAVLFFGEIIPQSVCSRYGLAIGARLSALVRLLIFLCSPVAWPMGKLLDLLIGPDHHTLFRRRQLKELVSIHAEDAGMGGALTRDEIKVITGALDLTSKVAYRAMTPLDKVFMLSSSDRLDEPTLRSILRSGHSRIPVHREGDRGDVVGLVLVKELLQYRLGSTEDVPVSMLRIRSIPRLPATTRMYDMLRLFQTGRSHIAVLTQPPPGELQRLLSMDPSMAARRGEPSRSRNGKSHLELTNADGGAIAAVRQGSIGAAGDGNGGAAASGHTLAMADTHRIVDDTNSVAAEADGDAEAYLPYSLYYARSGGIDTSYATSTLDPQESSEAATAVATLEAPASFRHWSIAGSRTALADDGETNVSGSSGGDGGGGISAECDSTNLIAGLAEASPSLRIASVFGAAPAFAIAAEAAAAEAASELAGWNSPDAAAAATGAAAEVAAQAPPLTSLTLQQGVPPAPPPPLPAGSQRLSRIGLQAATTASVAAAAVGGVDSREAELGCDGGAGASPRWPRANGAERAHYGGAAAAGCGLGGDDDLKCTAGPEGDPDAGYGTDEAEEGRPIGIITIEDVIEELIRAEIVDETDRYVDNNRLIRANQAQLAQSLPEHLAKVLAAAGASKKAAALHRAMSGNFLSQAITPSRRSFGAGLGVGASGSMGWGHGGSVRDMSHGSSSHHQPLRAPLLSAEQI